MIDNDWHDLTCSATASEVTTLWRYRNQCIIINLTTCLLGTWALYNNRLGQEGTGHSSHFIHSRTVIPSNTFDLGITVLEWIKWWYCHNKLLWSEHVKAENWRISWDCTKTNLIVGWEDELEDDDKANEGRLRVVKPKRTVQFTSVHQQGEHHKAQESVHLNTTEQMHCTAKYNIQWAPFFTNAC